MCVLYHQLDRQKWLVDLRGELTVTITQHRDTPGLVESQPMFNSIAISLETDSSISSIVVQDIPRQPALVLLVEG